MVNAVIVGAPVEVKSSEISPKVFSTFVALVDVRHKFCISIGRLEAVNDPSVTVEGVGVCCSGRIDFVCSG